MATIASVSVLITGIGYIGSALAARLLAQDEDVVGLESFYCTDPLALAPLLGNPRFHLAEGDVADPACVDGAFSAGASAVTTVYHLAAQPSAAAARLDPEYTERTNLVGSRVVLEAAKKHAARTVFGGSFRVYGDDLPDDVHEALPYGRVGDLSHLSKVYVEQLGRMVGGPFVSVRLGVVYGPAPAMKDNPSFMTVPNLFCWRAVHSETLRVLEHRGVGFIHVDDAARALEASATLLEQPDAEAWQVANAVSEVRTVDELAGCVWALAAARGREVRIEGVQEQRATVRVRSRLEEVGFSPPRTLEGTLGAVLDYWERAGV